MSDYKGVPTISSRQMSEWTEICKAFAKREKANLLFVNDTSCGIEYSNGEFAHLTVEGMVEYLSRA